MRRSIALAMAAAAALALPARAAAPTMAEVLRATYSLHDYGGVALSPDGGNVAYSESWHPGTDPAAARAVSAIYVRPVAGGPARRVTAASGDTFAREGEPVWSPDGKHIAFLSDARSKEQDELFVADADGAHVRQVGSFKGDLARLAWSPNGDAISLLYIANAGREAGALAPGARDVGVIGEAVEEQRLSVVDVASGSVREITPPDVYVYEYDWSPLGNRFAVTYAKGNGDNNWWVAKLAVVDASTAEMRDVWAPKYQMNEPRWSPDGKQISFIGGIMSDFGSVGGDAYVIDPDNVAHTYDPSGAQRLAFEPSFAGSIRSLRWAAPRKLVFLANAQGALHLYTYAFSTAFSMDDAHLAQITDRAESIGGWSSIRGETFAAVRQSFDRPAEVWAGPANAMKQLTNANAGAQRYYGDAKSITWKSDEFTVQGWLIAPLDVDPAKKYPLVVTIHGGPSSAFTPSFGNRFTSALASQGYYVFEPNPRGSFGEGEAFTAANVKDFGYGDWRDDLAGIDAAIAQAPIDPNRLGLFGWSYGGYMAMWAETQTARFKGIVAGAGVANWQSYYGENKIDEWMIPFFGASVYDDPAVYAKSSPMTFIKNSKTPILMLQGERDEEVPAPQSFEFWHAMTTLGVPTQLRVYADEGHAPQKPGDQIDILTRMVGWFDKYVK